jgi:hypothetical protein
MRWPLTLLTVLLAAGTFQLACAQAPDLPEGAPSALRQFDTDLTQHTVPLSELRSGGPSKDGIPSIDAPQFVRAEAAANWIAPQEPVILLEHQDEAKAYPLQILTFHEIVNDRIAGTPVAVTFCPLCYSAIVFERTLDGEPVTFGVSGLLRKSDLVMYDRKTESLWQQLTGTAIVGTRAGTTLDQLPAQIVSFRQFRARHPGAPVLSRETGHDRPYGQNPYAGYDDIDKRPFAFRGETDGRLPPMMKVVAVSEGGQYRAYPHPVTKQERVVHDTIGDRPIAVFHAQGAVSALDARRIADSKATGSTGVFDRRVDTSAVDGTAIDGPLRFRYTDGRFVDTQTESTWSITGRATSGPLEGTQLQRLPHGDYFAFAWLAFRPETTIYRAEAATAER